MMTLAMMHSAKLNEKNTIILILFIGYSKPDVVQNYTTLQKINADAGICDSENSFILHRQLCAAVNSIFSTRSFRRISDSSCSPLSQILQTVNGNWSSRRYYHQEAEMWQACRKYHGLLLCCQYS